jgi:hypothetical protein
MAIENAVGPIHQRDDFLQQNTPRSNVRMIARSNPEKRNPVRSGISVFGAIMPTRRDKKFATPQAVIKR